MPQWALRAAAGQPGPVLGQCGGAGPGAAPRRCPNKAPAERSGTPASDGTAALLAPRAEKAEPLRPVKTPFKHPPARGQRPRDTHTCRSPWGSSRGTSGSPSPPQRSRSPSQTQPSGQAAAEPSSTASSSGSAEPPPPRDGTTAILYPAPAKVRSGAERGPGWRRPERSAQLRHPRHRLGRRPRGALRASAAQAARIRGPSSAAASAFSRLPPPPGSGSGPPPARHSRGTPHPVPAPPLRSPRAHVGCTATCSRAAPRASAHWLAGGPARAAVGQDRPPTRRLIDAGSPSIKSAKARLPFPLQV